MSSVYGHDEAVAAFRDGVAAGRLHHAWLITGPEGIGKALLARSAGAWLLAAQEDRSPNFQVAETSITHKLISAESHPDFKLIEREVWEENVKPPRLKPKDKRTDSDAPSRSIRVPQIRWLRETLNSKPAFSPWRAIIVDSADDLEAPAANALLKSLEEPPPSTVFFLVSHAPERLLPTIRSRCRLLRLSPLAPDAMTAALRAALPDADAAEIASLAEVGEGSPGRAIAFRGLDIAGLDQAMRALAVEGDPTNAKRSALAQSLSGKAAQPRYEVFLARAPSIVAAAARARSGPALAETLVLYEKARDLAGGAVRLSLDQQSVVFELAGLIAGLAARPERRAA